MKNLHIFADGAGTNSIYIREGLAAAQTKIEEISIEKLDRYCERLKIKSIDLLKLDVEGHELDVLKGAHSMLKRGLIRCIQFEYGGTYINSRILLKDMFDALLPHGYKIYKIYPNKLFSVGYYHQKYENYQYANWIALKD